MPTRVVGRPGGMSDSVVGVAVLGRRGIGGKDGEMGDCSLLTSSTHLTSVYHSRRGKMIGGGARERTITPPIPFGRAPSPFSSFPSNPSSTLITSLSPWGPLSQPERSVTSSTETHHCAFIS